MTDSDQESSLSRFLPPQLYQQLQLYQQSRGYSDLTDALVEALQNYFDLVIAEPISREGMLNRLQELEKRVSSLTRELVFLRQEIPNTYDRLREQLATVRLSHSGLLQNLRDRIEVLEQSGLALPPKSLPDRPDLEDDNEDTGDLSI